MPQYNGVWTLQSQSQALTSQQWVTDPNFKNTTLLLQADNAVNTLQNNTFIDSSTNGLTITRGANATQGSYTQFSQQPGYWSNYFNGSTDYITTPSSATLALGTGSFTIEAWIYINSIASGGVIASSRAILGAGSLYWNLGVDGSNPGQLLFQSRTSGGTQYYARSALNAIAANQWYHVAATRTSGGLITVYVNGIAGPTTVNDGSNNLTESYVAISLFNYTGFVAYFPGYISNFRIVKDVVYTSNFTPSLSPLTNISNTVLLTCQSNRFVDNSTANSGTGFALTSGGTPSVQPFSPLVSQYQWTSSFIGGSAYFDGSSYVTVPNATSTLLGSSDFTFEFWANRKASSAIEDVVLHWNSVAGGTGYGAIRLTIAASSTSLYLSTNGTTWAVISTVSVAVPNNGWFYCALVRSGGNISLFINGTRVTTTTTITSGTALYAGTVNRVGYMNLTADVRSWTGYVSNFRFTKSAVYDPTLTTMTVPTALTVPIANTQTQLEFTNAGIYDGTMKNVLTTVGNAQVSTSVVKYGSGSMAFDGTGDTLITPATRDFDFGNGNFTIEAWIYTTSLATDQGICSNQNNGNASTLAGWVFNIGTSGQIVFADFSAGAASLSVTSSNGAIVINNWYHVAVCKSETTVRVFVNGVSVASGTSTASVPAGTNNQIFTVGNWRYSVDTNREFTGYIDTAYALIIQWDGYVLKGANWKNEFFKYDYIGAPWHDEWKKDHPYWNKNNTNEVGNGGFSLRSKRLLDFLASSSAITQIHPEDWAICKTYYNYLVEQNFKFAPTEMAYKFAVDGIPWDGQFGFHSIRATDLTKFKSCDLQAF